MASFAFARPEGQQTQEFFMSSRSSQWEEGRAAKLSGATASADPYEVGSQQSADWLEGFTVDEPEQNIDRPEPGEG
ncbi:hypothetical protein MKK88_27680 [Methylobacterium sp. E-005]|uniref:hypothetical protein n=1 Tax=Methylobacterium sp. E-005 TaxID=2836549 RepID=UPI001FBAAB86|nr:hypothetical protein [Methylobacterium sp. E-005]MCJ2089739.1 hypothetical protein [Methylobacterium sp. E-005]